MESDKYDVENSNAIAVFYCADLESASLGSVTRSSAQVVVRTAYPRKVAMCLLIVLRRQRLRTDDGVPGS